MIHTYKVTDPSTPEEFKHLVKSSTRLKVQARLVSDELSAHRNDAEQTRTFDLRIYEIHPDPQDYYVTVQDNATHEWAQITVDEDVRFTVVS